MINNPVLPPKSGYVEVEFDGIRTYKNVTTGELIEFEHDAHTEPTMEADLAAMMVDHEYRLLMLELGLTSE